MATASGRSRTARTPGPAGHRGPARQAASRSSEANTAAASWSGSNPDRSRQVTTGRDAREKVKTAETSSGCCQSSSQPESSRPSRKRGGLADRRGQFVVEEPGEGVGQLAVEVAALEVGPAVALPVLDVAVHLHGDDGEVHGRLGLR
jgi:hypothetical protein